MKILGTIIASLILFTYTHIGYAQSFSIAPESLLLTDSIPVDGATTLQFSLANLTNSDLALSWDLLELDLPAGWNYNLCDYLDCLLPPLSATNDMLPIPALLGDGVYMKLWVAPLDIPGDGVARFHVYETGNTSTGDTITFRVNASGFTGILEESAKQITVVPNPISDRFNINGLLGSLQNDVQVSLIDTRGRTTRLSKRNGDQYDVGQLASGIYSLVIVNGTDVVSKKVIIQ
ncbi:MAG: hypothetical protein ACI97X_001919 [Oceanospirillaceae bacterium]|jgi:hypothetical protein